VKTLLEMTWKKVIATLFSKIELNLAKLNKKQTLEIFKYFFLLVPKSFCRLRKIYHLAFSWYLLFNQCRRSWGANFFGQN